MRKAWKQSHPGKQRQYKLKRKALEAGVQADFTSEQWRDTLAVFGNLCAYCERTDNSKGPLHQDHFISVANGGGYTIGNIVPACRSCNCGKAHRDYDWILRKYGQGKYGDIVGKLNALALQGA